MLLHMVFRFQTFRARVLTRDQNLHQTRRGLFLCSDATEHCHCRVKFQQYMSVLKVLYCRAEAMSRVTRRLRFKKFKEPLFVG